MNPVEDIIINKQAPQPKKGGKIILILIFILAILLVGSCGAFYWYTNFYETPKAAFFKYLGQTNIPEIMDTEIYYNILERMNNSSYETNTEANFTTTEKTDFTQNVDVSNFLFTINTLSNKDKKEGYFGANITYKDNPFFDLEIINVNDNMAIGSSEVLDKYIATSKNSLADSLRRTTGMEKDVTADTVSEEMKDFANNRIDLDEEYKKQKLTEYSTMIMEKVPEEAVTLTENSPITINSEVVNTKAYALMLDANSYRDVVTRVLTNLKSDTEFLGKVVTGEASEPVVEPEEVKTPKPITIEKIEGQTVEHETAQELQTEEPVSNEEPIPDEEESIPVNLDEEEPFQEELETQEEPELDVLKAPEMDLPDANQDTMFPMDFTSNEEELVEEEQEQEDIIIKLIEALMFNQKLDMSVEELQNKLDEKIQSLDMSTGLEVTVYVRDVDGEAKETIKILANLSDTATLDIEYPESSKAKVTFLDDVTTTDDEGTEVIKNQGNSIEVKRTNTDIETGFNIVLNTIEEKKVVEKLQLDITTKGTDTSKTYENEVIIKSSDSEGDTKVNIKNIIDFHTTKVEKVINEENSIFVDQISDEEANNLFANVMIRLMGLYSDKILNMNFVDVTGNEEDADREIYSFGKTTADTLLPGQTFDDPTVPVEDTNTTDNEQTDTQEGSPETPPLVVTEQNNSAEQNSAQDQSQPTTPPANENNNNQQGENNNQQQSSGGESNNNNQNENNDNSGNNNGGSNDNNDNSNNNNNNNNSNNTDNNQNTNVNSDSAVSVETITKTNIKNILANQIEIMKNEAHNRGKEFTLKDLSNLPKQIEGMNVSSIITEDKATIKMAGYTFYVNKDLTLTEE